MKERDRDRRSNSSSEQNNKKSKRNRHRSEQKKKEKRRRSSYSSSSSEQYRSRRKNNKTKQRKQDKNVKRERSRQKQRQREKQKQQRKVKYEGWNSSQSQNQKRQPKQKQQLKQQQQIEQQKPKKQQPNFQPSGILLQFYNARDGISLKFHQPTESHKPINQWRVYPFKDGTPFNAIILKQSCYLIGKDERVCDILCENPSISRQHAVIQFRSIYNMEMNGEYTLIVKPYIMDLDSTNGTFLNKEKIEPSRYYQLLNKDVLTFGHSEREYVMFLVPDISQ